MSGENKGAKLKSIAVVSGKIGCAFNSVVAQGIERHAEKLGIKRKSIIYHSARDRSDKACTRELLDVLKNPSIDGIIAVSFTPEKEHIPMLIKQKVPIVFLERHIKGLHGVKVNNYKGGMQAAEYLVKKGYKKPGLIIDPQSSDKNSASFERLQGFNDGLKKYGLRSVAEAVALSEIHSIEHGRGTFEKLEDKMSKIDSVFSVAGDLVAVGFMVEAKANGCRIPKDIAVIGFDGMETAGIVEPVLTTIKQPIESMGGKALDHIKSLILKPNKGFEHIMIDTEVIPGGTA